jgi:hypothetical protein
VDVATGKCEVSSVGFATTSSGYRTSGRTVNIIQAFALLVATRHSRRIVLSSTPVKWCVPSR